MRQHDTATLICKKSIESFPFGSVRLFITTYRTTAVVSTWYLVSGIPVTSLVHSRAVKVVDGQTEKSGMIDDASSQKHNHNYSWLFMIHRHDDRGPYMHGGDRAK